MVMPIEKFLKPPTREEWRRELRRDWAGPDGSSFSTDTICGVLIGCTSTDWKHHRLPANGHDYKYRIARRLRLPERYRRFADRDYRNGCLRLVRLRIRWYNPLRPIAVARCHARYAALRVGARFAWTRKAKVRDSNWKRVEK